MAFFYRMFDLVPFSTPPSLVALSRPAFKYTGELAFSRQGPHYVPFGEALSAFECAELLDDGWNLKRNGDVICRIYQRMVEFLLKLVIEAHNKNEVREEIRKHVDVRSRTTWIVRSFAPKTHNLGTLLRRALDETAFTTNFAVRNKQLELISNCAVSTVYDADGNVVGEVDEQPVEYDASATISYKEFSEAAQEVDQLIMDIISFLKTTKPVQQCAPKTNIRKFRSQVEYIYIFFICLGRF